MHNPITAIEFDSFKAKLNRAKHGVSFFSRSKRCTISWRHGQDPDTFGEQRFVTLGADANGRLLIVVYTMRGEIFD